MESFLEEEAVTAGPTTATEGATGARAARAARLAWLAALSASVLLAVLRFTLDALGYGLPPLVACWLGQVAVLGAGIYAALAYARGERRRASITALVVLLLVVYVAAVLPTNPAECAAYLQSLGPS